MDEVFEVEITKIQKKKAVFVFITDIGQDHISGLCNVHDV